MAAEVQSLLNALNALRELESSIASLYRKCAEVWPEEKDLWQKLARDEDLHAQCGENMAGLVAKAPDSFQAAASFNPRAIRTFVKYVSSVAEKVDNRTVSRDKMLFIARDIEQAILEAKHISVVRSTDAEFQALVDRLVKETEAHRKVLIEKIRALRAGPHSTCPCKVHGQAIFKSGAEGCLGACLARIAFAVNCRVLWMTKCEFALLSFRHAVMESIRRVLP